MGVTFPHGTTEATQAGLDELARLVDTAGADVAGRIVQRRTVPDSATYLGRGKAEELLELCLAVDADTVVFDDDLAPAQQRNLEKILGRTAIDRTAVILDIFAQNARTPEGRAQVELALLRYRLTRLRGRGHSLSQQAGGIGTRGPGETRGDAQQGALSAARWPDNGDELTGAHVESCFAECVGAIWEHHRHPAKTQCGSSPCVAHRGNRSRVVRLFEYFRGAQCITMPPVTFMA